MKSILKFYLFLLIPFALIIFLAMRNFINSAIFVLLLSIYIIFWHPFISGLRLLDSKKISRKKFWKIFIPGWNWKYFNFLFFNLDR